MLDAFVGIVTMGADTLAKPSADPTDTKIDSIATQISSLLTLALKTVGRYIEAGGQSALWWTERCQQAFQTFQATKRQSRESWTSPKEKKAFLKVVQEEKRNY